MLKGFAVKKQTRPKKIANNKLKENPKLPILLKNLPEVMMWNVDFWLKMGGQRPVEKKWGENNRLKEKVASESIRRESTKAKDTRS